MVHRSSRSSRAPSSSIPSIVQSTFRRKQSRTNSAYCVSRRGEALPDPSVDIIGTDRDRVKMPRGVRRKSAFKCCALKNDGKEEGSGYAICECRLTAGPASKSINCCLVSSVQPRVTFRRWSSGHLWWVPTDKLSGAATGSTVEYTATYLVFAHRLNSREIIRRRVQCLDRGRRESSAQLCEWCVSVHIQLVTKPVQEFTAFQPYGQCHGFDMSRQDR